MVYNQLVSIIVPTFNRAELIKETLDSIISQTYTNWECIVIDDGSTDNTAKVINHYISKDSRFTYAKRPSTLPSGGNAARNFGFEISNGDYIQWFDDDDIMLPHYLEERISQFGKDINFVVGLGIVTDQNLENKSKMSLDKNISLFKGVANGRNQLITNSVIFKKLYLEGKDLFNVNLTRGQESEFYSRLFYKANRSEYKVVNFPLFLYRQHIDTKTHKNETYNLTFKNSEAFVALENFKRSLILKDGELTQFLYRVVINLLFRAVEHHDRKNIRYIMDEFIPIVKKIDSILSRKLQLSVSAFKTMGRGFYKVEMYFKNYQLYK